MPRSRKCNVELRASALSKVGTGFNAETLDSLYAELRVREIDRAPFVDRVRDKTAHWVRPELVANVAFTEWTPDTKLRHPRFEGLRPDKAATDVHREATPPD